MPMPSRRTLLPLLGMALGALVIVGALAVQHASMATPASSGIGGPFSLVDGDGRPVTDVCPTTLDAISQTFKALGPGRPARALFVTLDPERDTPTVMKDYLSSFDPRILGLTGSRSAIDKIAREYRVYAKKVPTGDGGYSVDHTGVVYLMDGRGQFVESFNPDLDKPKDAAATLSKYM